MTTPTTLKERILSFMVARPGRRLSLREIRKGFGKPARETVVDALKELIRERKVVRVRKNHYTLAKAASTVSGVVQGHPDGFGFVVPDQKGMEDIYLSRREMRRVMHGDRVTVRPEKGRNGQGQGRVVEVLERGQRRLVGVVRKDGDRTLLVPMDPRVAPAIPLKAPGPLPPGQVAAVEMTRYGSGYAPPEARLERLLGSPDDPEVQARAVIFRYGWPEEFPEEARQQAEGHGTDPDPADLQGRRDLQALRTFTVDGETARDFDDAVSIERTGAGGYRLYVSIADVARYVPRGTPVDEEAYARGTSLYFPDRALPMLPPALSTGICSLVPGTPRLARTALLEFDRRGQWERTELCRSVIRSDARLSYTEVGRLLVDGDPEVSGRYPELVEPLRVMEELTHLLMDRRRARGGLDFELPETEILLDGDNMPTDIRRGERTIAHRMIEEFMIAANEAVARYLRERRFPCVYRVHEGPDEDTLDAIAPFLSTLGYRLHRQGEKVSSLEIQRVLEACRGKPEERVLNRMLLRSMKQAVYDPENIGHFGLASAAYLHFTSPIRRYPDLMVHRLLDQAASGQRPGARALEELADYLQEAADHSSRRERLAMDAEREMVDLKKAQFMTGKIGEVHSGIITGLTNFGFFVELDRWFVEGLVNLKSLDDDFYRYHETAHLIRGQNHGRTFRMGGAVTVRVVRVKLFQGEIDFELAEP